MIRLKTEGKNRSPSDYLHISAAISSAGSDFFLHSGKHRELHGLDPAIDFRRFPQLAVNGQNILFNGNAEKPFVLFQVRQDQVPVRIRELRELAAVELILQQPRCGSRAKMAPPEASEKRLEPG